MPCDIAVCLARLLGAGNLLGRQQQDGLDGCFAGDIDQLIDGLLSVADQLQKRQQKLSVLAEEFRDFATVHLVSDLIRLSVHGYSFQENR